MLRETGDAKIDRLLAKNSKEVQRLESIAEAKAAENQKLIAKFYESRAKRKAVTDGH